MLPQFPLPFHQKMWVCCISLSLFRN